MWLVIAVGSAVLFGLAGWWMKASQMNGGDNTTLLLGLYASGTAGFAVHASLAGSWPALGDWRIWLAGAIIGAGSAWGNAVFMKALAYGPASLTSPLTNLNIAAVVAMSVLLYDEPLGLAEAAGIALLFAAVILISIRRHEPLTIREKRWFAYVALAIVLFSFRNGGLKVTGELGLADTPILLVGYALSLLWFAAAGMIRQRRLRNETSAERGLNGGSLRTGMRYGLLAGLFSYAGLQLYAVALQTGKANLAAPIFATNSLVVAAGAIIVYRERLTRTQWLAFACMIAGLAVIRL